MPKLTKDAVLLASLPLVCALRFAQQPAKVYSTAMPKEIDALKAMYPDPVAPAVPAPIAAPVAVAPAPLAAPVVAPVAAVPAAALPVSAAPAVTGEQAMATATAPAQAPVAARADVPSAAASRFEVVVSEPVTVQETPFYYGGGISAFGLVGALIGSQVYKSEPERIAAYVVQEKINISAIVKDEFERQINADPDLVKKYKSFGPASFKLFVVYGITSVPFSDYRPYLSVNVQLLDASGAVKWKNREYVGAHGDAKSIPYPEFFKSSAVFKSEFDSAANEVMKLMMKNFKR